MKLSKLFFMFLTVILLLSLFPVFNQQVEAATKEAIVDVDSGSLSMRSGPGNKYKVVSNS
ncbi:hypothetical protein SM124_19640 [Bacillus sp. 31A1R]|uniref:Uncharacterized protein n=1 Tax=Robertmurraya mangrovi TaxID=3098077 RepID=A0ABU5J3F5_9BACI|nr:hypothetical protein [Bacillus sp. 31A1R]MDZ5473937.1 hypothetical protein [Bacillus sp. 31A1R]